MCKLADKVKQSQAANASTAPEPVAGRPCPSPAQEAAKKQETQPWELSFRVTSTDSSRRPENITVMLETLEGGSGTKSINSQTDEFKPEEGTGERKFKVTATADKWELVAPEEVTLSDGDKKSVEVKLRPKPWELSVRVTCLDDKSRPESVTLTVETLSGGSGTITRSLSMSAQSEELKVEVGTGERKFKITASADKWELVTSEEVTLTDGDKKFVEVKLRPKPWIEFKVMHKDKVVEGVTLKLLLPGGRKEEPVTKDTEVRFDNLNTGACTIEELSHQEIWEVEELT